MPWIQHFWIQMLRRLKFSGYLSLDITTITINYVHTVYIIYHKYIYIYIINIYIYTIYIYDYIYIYIYLSYHIILYPPKHGYRNMDICFHDITKIWIQKILQRRKKRRWTIAWVSLSMKMCPSLQTWTGWSWTSALTTPCSRGEKSDSCRCFLEAWCFLGQSMSAMIRIQWFPLLLNYDHQGILMHAAGNSELETLG